MKYAGSTTSRPSGFSLIEVLIAIAVIAILVAAIFGVGQQVLTRQKINQTEGVLASLDRALEEYRIETRILPRLETERYIDALWDDIGNGQSPIVDDETQQTFLGGISDYRGEDFAWLPNAAYFVFISQGYENIDAIVGGIPGQFSETITSSNEFRTQILDAWGQPVLFVTPDNPLAEAIFGECPSDRPYFMSAGPDGHYGVPTDIGLTGLDPDELRRKIAEYREDNIYSLTPGSVDASFDFSILSAGDFE